MGNKQVERKITNPDIYKDALGKSLFWQCRGFGTKVLNHRGPVVACKPSLWPHLLQSSNLFTVQLTSLLFCYSFPSPNSSVFLGFRVLSCRFLLGQIGTSLNSFFFCFWTIVMLFRRIQLTFVATSFEKVNLRVEMNEDLHLTHFFHETLQHLPYPKSKIQKLFPSFINKHKSSIRK